jgi:hypothetical protein
MMLGLRCVICEKIYSADTLYTCLACGSEGILNVLYDYEQVQQTFRPELFAGRPHDIRRSRVVAHRRNGTTSANKSGVDADL